MMTLGEAFNLGQRSQSLSKLELRAHILTMEASDDREALKEAFKAGSSVPVDDEIKNCDVDCDDVADMLYSEEYLRFDLSKGRFFIKRFRRKLRAWHGWKLCSEEVAEGLLRVLMKRGVIVNQPIKDLLDSVRCRELRENL